MRITLGKRLDIKILNLFIVLSYVLFKIKRQKVGACRPSTDPYRQNHLDF